MNDSTLLLQMYFRLEWSCWCAKQCLIQTPDSWDDDFSKLKYLRWIRNQLSHEVGYDSDICEESDYDWLDDFRRRLFLSSDPLAAMNKAIKAERQRIEEQRRQSQRTQPKTQNIGSPSEPPRENTAKETPQGNRCGSESNDSLQANNTIDYYISNDVDEKEKAVSGIM